MTNNQPEEIWGAAAEVPVKLSVVLGKTEITAGQLMRMEHGSIVEIDRQVGDAIDIYAGDTLIARGEIVVNGNELGIRITEILDS